MIQEWGAYDDGPARFMEQTKILRTEITVFLRHCKLNRAVVEASVCRALYGRTSLPGRSADVCPLRTAGCLPERGICLGEQVYYQYTASSAVSDLKCLHTGATPICHRVLRSCFARVRELFLVSANYQLAAQLQSQTLSLLQQTQSSSSLASKPISTDHPTHTSTMFARRIPTLLKPASSPSTTSTALRTFSTTRPASLLSLIHI